MSRAVPLPLHTRLIQMRLRWAAVDRLAVEGRLTDLRKRAILPFGGRLRGPGVVHDMSVRITIDTPSLTIVEVEPRMDAYPYEASPETGGERCPGRLGDVQRVVGLKLERSYGDDLASRIGGAAGCFHIFTLLRLIGPAVVAALGEELPRAALAAPERRVAGETLFARSIVVDGFMAAEAEVVLHGSLTDVFQQIADPAGEELRGGTEVTMQLHTSLPAMTVDALEGRIRSFGADAFAPKQWTPLSQLPELAGVAIRKGFSARVEEILGAGAVPPLHLVFMMAPVVMQCMPSLLDAMSVGLDGARGTGTAPNSCHMWRAEGPLHQWVRDLESPAGED